MAFLDNSGDTIIDVVLTDEGRQRLAKGDGSFNVAKFALGDDEIILARKKLKWKPKFSFENLVDDMIKNEKK